jgi:hypothetical protein
MVEPAMTESDFSSRIPVEFRIENVCTLNGELRTVLAPRTVGRILSLLPIDSRLHLWSQEAYFGVGARIGLEKAVTQCKCGDLAYWPQGDAICLFFKGMTPLSKVNPIGRISTSALETIFERIKTGMMIRFSRS